VGTFADNTVKLAIEGASEVCFESHMKEKIMEAFEFFEKLFQGVAMAQEVGASAPKGPSLLEVLIMPAGFLLIMYFFMILPQQKKAKSHTELLANLKPGDEILTTGGLIGKIRSVGDGFVSLEVSPNTVIKVVKSAVSGLSKPPVGKDGSGKSSV